jgi:collagenase-like PrtC family protease
MKRLVIRLYARAGSVEGEIDYALEEPTSLNAIGLLPQLINMGVAAIKIEGRQRSPSYVTQVVGTLRAALDAAQRDPGRYSARPEWQAMLARHAEGAQVTQGAFERPGNKAEHTMTALKISLAPLAYYWSKKRPAFLCRCDAMAGRYRLSW